MHAFDPHVWLIFMPPQRYAPTIYTSFSFDVRNFVSSTSLCRDPLHANDPRREMEGTVGRRDFAVVSDDRVNHSSHDGTRGRQAFR